MEPQELTGAVAPPEPDGTKRLAGTARRAGATRDRRPRRQLDGPCDTCLRAPLPAPVELGLGLHRDRLLALRPGARRSAELQLRSSPASGATGCCRTSSSPRTRATSRAPSSGGPSSRRTRPRIRRRPGSCSRRCTRPPSGRCSAARGTRTRRRRSSRELLPKLAAWHDYLYRERTGAATAWSRSGIRGSRAWTTRRSGTPRWNGSRFHPRRSPSTSASTSSSSMRPSVRRTPVRPLRVPRQALPRLRIRRPNASARTVPSSCGTCSSTRSSSQANRDLAEISRVDGRRSRAVRDLGGPDRGVPRDGTMGRGRGNLFRLRRPSGELIRMRTGAGILAAVRRSSERRNARSALVERLGACQVAIDGAGRGCRRAFRPTTRASSLRCTGGARFGR